MPAFNRCLNSLVLQPLVPEPLLYEGRKLNIRSLHLLLPGRNGSATRLFHDYGQWMVAGSRLAKPPRALSYVHRDLHFHHTSGLGLRTGRVRRTLALGSTRAAVTRTS